MNIETQAILALWKNSSRITARVDQGAGAIHGIAFAEFIVLHLLANAPGVTMRRIDLAEALGRTASGVTRMLMPMEKTGLVRKQRNPRDARESLVKMSAGGSRIYAEAALTVDQQAQRQLGRLTQQQVGQLLELMEVLAA